MLSYADREYWQARYKMDWETFDWYTEYNEGQSELVKASLDNSGPTLVLGAGKSTMSEKMYEDGYHNITSIDFVQDVVRDMEYLARNKPGLNYVEMDARSMTFPDGSFKSIIDKGTIDSAVCGSETVAHVICSEIDRVTTPGGTFVMVSPCWPKAKDWFLDNNWRLDTKSFYGSGIVGHTTAYILTKEL